MTVRSAIPIADAARRLEYLQRCVDEAPKGAHQDAKDVRLVIGQIADFAIAQIKALKLNADYSDGIFEIEAALYAMILDRNPDCTYLITGEGFGKHVDGPAGDRMKAQAAANVAFFESLKSAPDGAAPVTEPLSEGLGFLEAAMLQSGIVPQTLRDDPELQAILQQDPLVREVRAAAGFDFKIGLDTVMYLRHLRSMQPGNLSLAQTDELFTILESEEPSGIVAVGRFMTQILKIRPDGNSSKLRMMVTKSASFLSMPNDGMGESE